MLIGRDPALTSLVLITILKVNYVISYKVRFRQISTTTLKTNISEIIETISFQLPSISQTLPKKHVKIDLPTIPSVLHQLARMARLKTVIAIYPTKVYGICHRRVCIKLTISSHSNKVATTDDDSPSEGLHATSSRQYHQIRTKLCQRMTRKTFQSIQQTYIVWACSLGFAIAISTGN